jgi:alpha-beta hydrolase superfamily lysophospholipase
MPSARTALMAALGGVVVLTMALTGCDKDSPTPTAPATPVGLTLAADFTGSGPGTLKSAETLATIDRRISRVSSLAARITYESKSGIDGSPQLVSGSVFVPMGSPPPDGWPVISVGHGTSGVLHECAPSLSPSLYDMSVTVAVLVKAGYVVTMSDYQGLGLDQTYHPYLDSTTAGYNVIDAVRAARKLVPGTSDRWLAFGSSQGGQASWAANELAGGYGGGMNLIGSVSVSPAADITGLADLAAAGALTLDQVSIMQWILVALGNEHPDFNLDDYRRGVVKEKWDVLSQCTGQSTQERADTAKLITPNDLRPASPAAEDTLREYLRQMGLPKNPTSAPMLVVYGGKDQLVAPQWTEAAIRAACGKGDVMQAALAPDAGHDDINGEVALDWIHDRFAGSQATNTCQLQEQHQVYENKVGVVPPAPPLSPAPPQNEEPK